MSSEIIADADHKMARAVEAMERDFQGIRTGRASTALVERIHVEYYGTSTPLNQLAGISVPEPHQIVIQPWDRGVLGAIEKAITKSDIGLMPNVDGTVVGALRGERRAGTGEALGIVETATVAATIEAADAGVKGASVDLLELRLADGLDGKGYLLFDGAVSDVEAAVAIAVARLAQVSEAAGPAPGGWTPISRVIPQLHREMRSELETAPRFGDRLRAAGGEA